MKANPAKDKAGLQAIEDGRIIVDIETGIITKPNGQRAERPTRQAYGLVYVGKGRTVFAHRVVWIAANGLIPDDLVVNHKNGIKWDNRIANLELLTSQENLDHAALLNVGVTRQWHADRRGSPYGSTGSIIPLRARTRRRRRRA